MGCLFYLSFMLGGGGGLFESIHTIFICENNRKSYKITHHVDFLRGSLDDMGMAYAIDISIV